MKEVITYTADKIKTQIELSDKWLYRSILAIYSNQTYEEQTEHKTVHNNKVGFNKFDSEIMSSMADQLNKQKVMGKEYYLTENQRKVARRRILKYSKQLVELANHNIGIKQLQLA